MSIAVKHINRSAAPGRAGSNKIRSYPAPKALATPADLKSEEVRAVVEAVNPLIADAFALSTKTRDFHWHLATSRYRDYHLLLDEQAASIPATIDPLAERLRRTGGATIRSTGHISQLQTIAGDNKDFVPPGEMIAELIEDKRHIFERQRAAIELTEEPRHAYQQPPAGTT